MAELEDFFDESIEEQRLVKEEERAEAYDSMVNCGIRTRNAGNCTQLHLVKITSCIARAINPSYHS